MSHVREFFDFFDIFRTNHRKTKTSPTFITCLIENQMKKTRLHIRATRTKEEEAEEEEERREEEEERELTKR